MTDYAALALALWEEYGEELPDAPGRMATILLKNLDGQGVHLTRGTPLRENQV